MYVPKKDPTHNPKRKLPTRARKRKPEAWYQVYGQGSQDSLHQEALQPVYETWGRIPHTIPRIVIGTRKTEEKNQTSMLPRKAERSPIPQSSLLRSWARRWTGLRRQSRNKMPNGRNIAVVIWFQLRIGNWFGISIGKILINLEEMVIHLLCVGWRNFSWLS